MVFKRIMSGLVLIVIFVILAFIIMPEPDTILNQYIIAWQDGKFDTIYQMLSGKSKSNITVGLMKAVYRDFFRESGFNILDVSNITWKNKNFFNAEVIFTGHFSSPYFGQRSVKYNLILIREGINWKIVWNYNLVYPGIMPGGEIIRKRIIPERGKIFDRNGVPLALKDDVYVIGVKPGSIENKEEIYFKFKKYLLIDPEWLNKKLNDPVIKPDWFIPVKTITEKEFTKIEEILRPVPGVLFRKSKRRVYPEGELVAHLVGYTSEVTKKWIRTHQDLDYQAGDKMGRSGIEKVNEFKLRGQVGYILFTKNIDSNGENLFRVLLKNPEIPGKDIHLTIDLKIQRVARDALAGRKGAIVILNPQTGEILALVNSPSFNPNSFSLGMTELEWSLLEENINNPLFNRALMGLYPPGSTFKVVTTAAALDSNYIKPDTIFNDTGFFIVNGNRIKNYQNKVFGEHLFVDAVSNSINSTFAKIGVGLGGEIIREYARKFGFDNKPNFPLPVAISRVGNLSDPVNLAWSSVGQGEVLATPFQMARVIATIASGGKLLKPIILLSNKKDDPEVIRRVVNSSTALNINKLLYKVVEEGTGKRARLPGVNLVGKTGTAEISNDSNLTHAWFIGFAPIDKPELAFAIFLEEGGVGGEDAAPVARYILKHVLNLNSN